MPPRRLWSFEAACKHHPVAGIDEAGRGPWAGPVVAAAVILNPDKIPRGIDDSKKLTREQRESLYGRICKSAHVGVGVATVEEIDVLNILQASLLAMERALAVLPVTAAYALVDGNKIPARLPCPGEAIIEGDGKSLSIAAASVIAKVTRDRMMAELAKEFPLYGWEHNAGYGTRCHQQALRDHGVTPHHRRSFSPIKALLGIVDDVKEAVA